MAEIVAPRWGWKHFLPGNPGRRSCLALPWAGLRQAVGLRSSLWQARLHPRAAASMGPRRHFTRGCAADFRFPWPASALLKPGRANGQARGPCDRRGRSCVQRIARAQTDMPSQSSELVALGSAIAELRREKGISTGDLAKHANLTPSDLEKIERREIEATLLDVVALAQALGSDAQRLLARAAL